MNNQIIKTRIVDFLSKENNTILCINGNWGVGKTHLWKETLNEFFFNNTLKTKKYAYVSLFGVNSLADLKLTIGLSALELDFNTQSTRLNWFKKLGFRLKKLWFWGLSKLGIATVNSPFLQKYFGGGEHLYFYFLKDVIICIDDIERKGTNLEIREILGLILLLKEQKNCRIALILNDED